MADVEAVSSSVVREYLSRKGLKETLMMLDKELPRKDNCISNRAQLAKELHINTLMKKNKESQESFRTMLEVIVQFMMVKKWQQHSIDKTRESNVEHNKRFPESSKFGLKIQGKSRHESLTGDNGDQKKAEKTSFDGSKSNLGCSSRLETNCNVGYESSQLTNYSLITNEEELTIVAKKHRDRTKTGSQYENAHDNIKKSLPSSKTKKSSGRNVFSTGVSKKVERTFVDNHNMQIKDSTRERIENLSSVPVEPLKNIVKNEVPDWRKEIVETKGARRNLLPLEKKASTEELIFEDIDENLIEDLDQLSFSGYATRPRKSCQSQPITLQQAKDLKTIIFGSPSGTFNPEWRNQGFSFCNLENLNYGIVQHKGGPCGLLASVQAVVLKQLLFKDCIPKQCLHFLIEERNAALCSALVEMLWAAGNPARLVLPSEDVQFIASGGYKKDKFTEKLVIYETDDRSDLEMIVKENLNQFLSSNGGCIFLLYSMILTRTFEKIREDMDDENGTLMGAHGYCTQDMVNLLLTGKAISNTFDDIIELDSGGDNVHVLKGIDRQSGIGFLSLFEHYKSCVIGSNLKCPKYPIWVVCSESHFSVLFSMKRSLVNERRAPKRFDLFYYDGLAGQTEEIRLTVDISGKQSWIESDELTPPLEHCIRTKWKDAVVHWNETEPLL